MLSERKRFNYMANHNTNRKTYMHNSSLKSSGVTFQEEPVYGRMVRGRGDKENQRKV